VAAALQADPHGYLRADQVERFAYARGYLELLVADMAEKGVSNRRGDLRRTATLFPKFLIQVQEAEDRLRVEVMPTGLPPSFDGPFTENEGLMILRSIAHDSTAPAGARVVATRFLLGYRGDGIDLDVHADLEKLSDEELDLALEALLQPVSPTKPES
jgi:hypothetical protein